MRKSKGYTSRKGISIGGPGNMFYSPVRSQGWTNKFRNKSMREESKIKFNKVRVESEKKKRPLTPERLQYEENFKKFKEKKMMKEEFVEELEKIDKWDKYTTGKESPNKKGRN